MSVLIILVVVVVLAFLFAGKATKTSLQEPPLKSVPRETGVQEVKLFVGRIGKSALWSSPEELAAGRRLMLFREQPIPSSKLGANLKSDDTISGDVNRVYAVLKREVKDLEADYQVDADLTSPYPLQRLLLRPNSIAAVFNLAPEIIDRHRSVVDRCREGDVLHVLVHSYVILPPGAEPKADTLRLEWVEVVAIDAEEGQTKASV